MSIGEGTGDGRDSMNDGIGEEHLARLRRLFVELGADMDFEAESDGPGPSCLNEVALARLADGDAASPATSEEMRHLAGCAHCRGELASLAALLDDPAIGAEIRKSESHAGARPDHTHHSRFTFNTKVAGALAAAAVVLIVARVATTRRTPASLDAIHRAPTIAALDSPRSLAPIGDVLAARTFAWSAVPGSDRYRLTLYDHSGRVVYEAQLTDTTLALPDTVPLARGVPYVWQVEARTAMNRWTPFETTEFVVVPPGATR